MLKKRVEAAGFSLMPGDALPRREIPRPNAGLGMTPENESARRRLAPATLYRRERAVLGSSR